MPGKQTRSKAPAFPAAQPKVQDDQEERPAAKPEEQDDQEERPPLHLSGDEEDISFEEDLQATPK